MIECLGSTTSELSRIVGPRYIVKRHMGASHTASGRAVPLRGLYAARPDGHALRVPPAGLTPELTIGRLRIPLPAVQAALSGYSDLPMRTVARERGAPYALNEV